MRRGKKLEKWEQEFYRKNKDRVDLKQRYSAEELAEQERLKKLLGVLLLALLLLCPYIWGKGVW